MEFIKTKFDYSCGRGRQREWLLGKGKCIIKTWVCAQERVPLKDLDSLGGFKFPSLKGFLRNFDELMGLSHKSFG